MLAIANTLVETCRLVMVRWWLGGGSALFAPLTEFKLTGRTGHPHGKRVSP